MLNFHKTQMNSTDATWFFRHVPSINSACKFQLIGSLHDCDNYKLQIYITNAWELKNAATQKTDEQLSAIFRPKTLC